jgi:single-strand DNA-binding protein
MASDINNVTLVGRLTRDAELRYTNTGTPVSRLSVAVNRSIKFDGQWTTEASFFDVVLWGKQAESLNQYLLKGKQIGVQGELRQNRWEQDGQNRSKVEIVANKIQLIGRVSDTLPQDTAGAKMATPPKDNKAPEPYNPNAPVDPFEDDIPF